MSKKKIFCGSGKIHRFDDGGWVANLSVYFDLVPEKYIHKSEKGKRFIKIKVFPKRSNEKELYIEVDTWQPDKKENKNVVNINVD